MIERTVLARPNNTDRVTQVRGQKLTSEPLYSTTNPETVALN